MIEGYSISGAFEFLIFDLFLIFYYGGQSSDITDNIIEPACLIRE